jgi:hypothetical protein
MDTGTGRFVMAKTPDLLDKLRDEYLNAKGVFQVGEELEIRGSRFKVIGLSARRMKLRLLPAKDGGR